MSQSAMTTYRRRYEAAQNTNNELGNRLRAARKALGISAKEVADRVGVAHSLVSQWESGICRPGPDNRLGLCVVLNVPPGELFADLLPKDRENGPLLVDDPETVALVQCFRRMHVADRKLLSSIVTRWLAAPLPETSDDAAPSDATGPTAAPEIARFG